MSFLHIPYLYLRGHRPLQDGGKRGKRKRIKATGENIPPRNKFLVAALNNNNVCTMQMYGVWTTMMKNKLMTSAMLLLLRVTSVPLCCRRLSDQASHRAALCRVMMMIMASTTQQCACSLTGRRGRLALAAVTDSAPGSASWKVAVLNSRFNYRSYYFSRCVETIRKSRQPS